MQGKKRMFGERKPEEWVKLGMIRLGGGFVCFWMCGSDQ